MMLTSRRRTDRNRADLRFTPAVQHRDGDGEEEARSPRLSSRQECGGPRRPGLLRPVAGGEVADDAAPEKVAAAVERREGGGERGGEQRERESEGASRSFVLAGPVLFYR